MRGKRKNFSDNYKWFLKINETWGRDNSWIDLAHEARQIGNVNHEKPDLYTRRNK